MGFGPGVSVAFTFVVVVRGRMEWRSVTKGIATAALDYIS